MEIRVVLMMTSLRKTSSSASKSNAMTKGKKELSRESRQLSQLQQWKLSSHLEENMIGLKWRLLANRIASTCNNRNRKSSTSCSAATMSQSLSVKTSRNRSKMARHQLRRKLHNSVTHHLAL